jgi:hypothetical protein
MIRGNMPERSIAEAERKGINPQTFFESKKAGAFPFILIITMKVPAVLVLLSLSSRVRAHCGSQSPSNSKCSGCPPTFNGLLCASSTNYVMDQISACGYNGDRNKFTAAASTALLSPNNPASDGWCANNCGSCFRLCTTGGSLFGAANPNSACKVFQITDRCADGYKSVSEQKLPCTWLSTISNTPYLALSTLLSLSSSLLPFPNFLSQWEKRFYLLISLLFIASPEPVLQTGNISLAVPSWPFAVC